MEGLLVESDPQVTVLAGAFSPHGVTETAQNFVDELNGLTINRLAPKIQYMVSDTQLLIHSYTHTLIHSYTHTLIHSYTHTLIHSYTHTLIHSYTHTLIHSYTV